MYRYKIIEQGIRTKERWVETTNRELKAILKEYESAQGIDITDDQGSLVECLSIFINSKQIDTKENHILGDGDEILMLSLISGG